MYGLLYVIHFHILPGGVSGIRLAHGLSTSPTIHTHTQTHTHSTLGAGEKKSMPQKHFILAQFHPLMPAQLKVLSERLLRLRFLPQRRPAQSHPLNPRKALCGRRGFTVHVPPCPATADYTAGRVIDHLRP